MSEEVNDVLEIESKLDTKESEQQVTSLTEKRKYPALIVISTIYKVLSTIVGMGACIAIVVGLSKLGGSYRIRTDGQALIITSLIVGSIGVLVFLSASEILKLFIDIESNLRKQINLLNTEPSNDYDELEININDELKECEFCAENIKLKAIKCKFCGENFNKIDVEQLIKNRKEKYKWK